MKDKVKIFIYFYKFSTAKNCMEKIIFTEKVLCVKCGLFDVALLYLCSLLYFLIIVEAGDIPLLLKLAS